jgi:tryptophan synthase alpha chain
MTYASLLEAYGVERFARDIREAGATSTIVADLPIEAHPGLRRVQLVAPTSPAERIRSAAERTDGWLYLVSVTGTTGARAALSDRLGGLVERARSVASVPLLAGFGISTPEHAAEAGSLADGVVVGSRAIEVVLEDGAAGLRAYVAALRGALDAVASRDASARLR